ncbi:hypothetical protein NGI46_10775 [Peribacillus butanolivorans]|nr:hypothetical protein [Peribacillus butanolivorans]
MEALYQEVLSGVFSKGFEQGILKDQPIVDLIASFLCLMNGIFLELLYFEEHKFNKRFNQIWNIFWNGISKDV